MGVILSMLGRWKTIGWVAAVALAVGLIWWIAAKLLAAGEVAAQLKVRSAQIAALRTELSELRTTADRLGTAYAERARAAERMNAQLAELRARLSEQRTACDAQPLAPEDAELLRRAVETVSK